MPQSQLSRRRSLKLLTGALATAAFGPRLRAAGANDDVRVAVIGVGGKGSQHAEVFSKLSGIRVVGLCDVDPKRLDEQSKKLQSAGHRATDLRHILDKPDIDAVVIATPNHWHTPAAIWAMQAGKDVYVEKPVSHNLWEGTKLVEAAAKYSRIAQGGTQYRSCPGLKEAVEHIRAGKLGKIQWAHVPWFEFRPGIGKAVPHMPKDLDYNLYCGPAPFEPLTRPRLHYDWHWFFATGDGDLGNSAIHAFDVCRWFLGKDALPPRVVSVGGRFGVDDSADTPNTQLTVLDYDGLPVIIEDRNLPTKSGVNQMDHVRGIREGVIVQCEHGYFAGFRAGGFVYDNDGNKLKHFSGDNGATHQQNFIDAVRSRKTEHLAAPIRQTHLSSAVCHLGNISYRLATDAPSRSPLLSLPLASQTLERIETHLAANGVDARKTPLAIGPCLHINSRAETITSVDGEPRLLAAAQRLARGAYRPGFEVPEKV
jgi:predicted dehydrogenase